MNRQSANSLRILGIVATAIVVLTLILVVLYIGFFIVMMGGMSWRARVINPRATDSFYGALLLIVAIITGGIILIGRLAKGVVRVPVNLKTSRPSSALMSGQPPSPALGETERAVQRSFAPQSVPLSTDPLSTSQLARAPAIQPPAKAALLRPSPHTRKIIDRLALALAAQLTLSSITWFQTASRYERPPIFLPTFFLAEAPYAFLIYFLLRRPGRHAFTFLVAMLTFPILQILFNPVILDSYRQIYMNQAMGTVWLALSAVIYIVIIVLAYKAIQQTGLKPQPSWLILASVAVFFYFVFIREITPYLYSLWT